MRKVPVFTLSIIATMVLLTAIARLDRTPPKPEANVVATELGSAFEVVAANNGQQDWIAADRSCGRFYTEKSGGEECNWLVAGGLTLRALADSRNENTKVAYIEERGFGPSENIMEASLYLIQVFDPKMTRVEGRKILKELSGNWAAPRENSVYNGRRKYIYRAGDGMTQIAVIAPQ